MVVVSAELWLVRHGATDWSDAGRITGWIDVPLNDRGRSQARLLRARLRRENFDGVWASDLSRACETAHLALGNASTDARLRELNFGALEGRTWDQCAPAVQAQLVSFDDFAAPGGESVSRLKARVVDFAESLSTGVHIVFTHGGVIRVLLRTSGRDRSVLPGEVVRFDFSGAPHR
jgi:probable phosphoglycerate mutase